MKREALLQLLENAKTLMDDSKFEERQPAAPGTQKSYTPAEHHFYHSMVTLEAEILEQAAKGPSAPTTTKQKQFVPQSKGKRASTTKKKTQ